MDRRVDNVGRIVLPRNFRQRLGIHTGDIVDVTVQRDFLQVGPGVRRCAICGEENRADLHTIGTKVICTACLNRIKNMN